MLIFSAEPHHPLDTGAVIPAAVEDDDFAGSRKMLDVALHIHLRLFAVRWRRQCDDTKNARTDSLGNRLDHAAFSSGIAPFEDDHDPQPLQLYPFLKGT